MAQRWSIYIDIEGFGALYATDDRSLLALGGLMEGIYLIGSRCYFETPDRIFAHQTGDGFAVVSEFGAHSLDTPVAIAIALMRHVAASGCFAKATIAEGGFADISGCYPAVVRNARDAHGRVSMGKGVMTLFSVMGTALINAVALAKVSPSGALLTLHDGVFDRLPSHCVVHKISDRRLVSVDWVHSTLPLVAEIQSKAGLRASTASELKSLFAAYFQTSGVKEQWKANSNWYLSLGLAPDGT